MVVCRCRFGQQKYTLLSLTTCSHSAKIPHPWVQGFQSVMESKRTVCWYTERAVIDIQMMNSRQWQCKSLHTRTQCVEEHDLNMRVKQPKWKINMSDTVKKCLFFSGLPSWKITIMKDRSNKLYAPLTMKREVVGIQWWLRSGPSLHLEVLVLIVACSKDFGRVSNWRRSSGKQSCIWSGSTCRKAVNRMQTLVRYVGVTRVFFHGLQLLPIIFTQRNETCAIILNLWWSISRNRIENRTSSNLVMVMIGSACLLLIP